MTGTPTERSSLFVCVYFVGGNDMRAFDSYIHIFYQLFENKTLLLSGRQGNGIHQQLVSTCCLICAHYETDDKSQWKTNGISILLPYCHLTLTRDMKDSLFDFASHWSWLSMWRVEITDPLSLFFSFALLPFFFLFLSQTISRYDNHERRGCQTNNVLHLSGSFIPRNCWNACVHYKKMGMQLWSDLNGERRW